MQAETQLEISEFIDNLIGKRLVDKYRHLTYRKMADDPELEDYREDLLWADQEWWRLEDQLNEARLEDKWEADRAHRVWLGQFEN
jgi:hypothetical protein